MLRVCFLIFASTVFIGFSVFSQKVVVSDNAGYAGDASALLDVNSNAGKGLLLPRLTKAQREAMTAVPGMMVYQTDAARGLYICSGNNVSQWTPMFSDATKKNTVFGSRNTACSCTITGTENTLLGALAGNEISTSSYNTFVGAQSGQNCQSFGRNTCVGPKSGMNLSVCPPDNTTFVGNVFIGYQAGMDVQPLSTSGGGGWGNVIIGSDMRGYPNDKNKLYIHNSTTTTPLISGDFSSRVVTINELLVLPQISIAPTAVSGMIVNWNGGVMSGFPSNGLFIRNQANTAWVKIK